MDVLYEGSRKMQETYMKKYSKTRNSRKKNFIEVSLLICKWTRENFSDKEVRRFSVFFMVEMAGTAPACRKVSSSLLPSVVYFGYDYTARKKTKMYKRIIGVLTLPTNK